MTHFCWLMGTVLAGMSWQPEAWCQHGRWCLLSEINGDDTHLFLMNFCPHCCPGQVCHMPLKDGDRQKGPIQAVPNLLFCFHRSPGLVMTPGIAGQGQHRAPAGLTMDPRDTRLVRNLLAPGLITASAAQTEDTTSKGTSPSLKGHSASVCCAPSLSPRKRKDGSVND